MSIFWCLCSCWRVNIQTFICTQWCFVLITDGCLVTMDASYMPLLVFILGLDLSLALVLSSWMGTSLQEVNSSWFHNCYFCFSYFRTCFELWLSKPQLDSADCLLASGVSVHCPPSSGCFWSLWSRAEWFILYH